MSLKAKIKTICYFCLPETWKQFDKIVKAKVTEEIANSKLVSPFCEVKCKWLKGLRSGM